MTSFNESVYTATFYNDFLPLAQITTGDLAKGKKIILCMEKLGCNSLALSNSFLLHTQRVSRHAETDFFVQNFNVNNDIFPIVDYI